MLMLMTGSPPESGNGLRGNTATGTSGLDETVSVADNSDRASRDAGPLVITGHSMSNQPRL